MKQRLGIARCLLADPAVLILDEPMNGLDPGGIQEFRGFVRSFVEGGRTIVLSSHLLDEVEKTCDHVAIVDGGTIVAQGSIAELRGEGQVVFVEADDPERARRVLAESPAVERVVDDGTVLAVSILDEAAVPDLNRRLVEAGIAVRRLELQQASLEQRFLEITTRLENAA
jgi:ABC-2 type transport system ATP-binding protein